MNNCVNYNDIKSETAPHKFWKYVNYAEEIDKNYYDLILPLKNKQNLVQQAIFDEFRYFDINIIKLHNENHHQAIDSINDYTKKMIGKSINYINLDK